MGKIEYELYLRDYDRRNPNCVEDEDFETIECESCANYREAVKMAKQYSKKIPFKDVYGRTIRQVQIAAYVDDEEEYGTTYYLLWKETYVNGKGTGRYYTD